MTQLSDRLREIAEGSAARKVMFDEFAPAERSLNEALQGIADAIEEEAEAAAKPSPVTQVDVDAAAERAERAWVDWAVALASGMGVDTGGMTWEEVQATVEAKVEAMQDDAATVGTGFEWRSWADLMAATLGVNWSGMTDDALRAAVDAAACDLVAASLSSVRGGDAGIPWWPRYADGEPVAIGDAVSNRTVDRVTVDAEGWRIIDSGNRIILRGVVGEAVERPDTIERILADLDALGLEPGQAETVVGLLRRAERVGGR